MSEWDFLWGLEGQALEDAMSSGATHEEWNEIEHKKTINEWNNLKKLRDSNTITNEEFQRRKKLLFPK